MELVCPTTTPFAEYIEGATAITTLDAFLAERGQKKEPPKRVPYEIRLPFGGGWLLEVREEREVRRREAYPVEATGGGSAAEAPAPEVKLEGTAGAVSG